MSTESKRLLTVFLCHSSSDKSEVRKLYGRLLGDGVSPWLDAENLLPGQDWHVEITKAVKSTDVVIVCLSKSSVTKEGYVQREMKQALDVADEKPEGSIFIIPLRLEECPIPDRLSRWHGVNLFEEAGYHRLMISLRKRAETICVSPPGVFDDAESYFNRGNIYRKQWQLDLAMADYNQAIRLNPDFAPAHSGRGVIYLDRKQYDLAIAEFNQAISLKPDSARYYNNRGVAYSKKGQFDLAVADYTQAINLQPDSAEFHEERGTFYSNQERCDLAIADYNQAIKFQPDSAHLYLSRGYAYSGKQMYDDAMTDYNQAIRLRPDSPEAYFNRGIVYEYTNFKKAAIADFRRSLELFTDANRRIEGLKMLQNLNVKL